MSDQFYNYLSNRLSEYLKDNLIAGQKFFIEFDDGEQVEAFYKSLKKREHKNFTFTHKKGNPYKTFFITYNGVNLIVAHSENTTPGFLVTLRNQLTQNSDLSDYALLVICSSAIDSIQEGMGNLQDKDLPFNLEKISVNLKEDIQNSDLSNAEKEILEFYLTKKEEDSFQNTLWDYEDVFAVLNSGVITREEYVRFGLFFDENLNDFSIKNIKDRIKENNSMYERILVIKESNESKKELEKIFDEVGVRELNKDTWQSVDYSFILKHILPPVKPINYIESVDKKTFEGLTYWEKFKSKITGPKYFIVFNNTKQTTISFDLEFDSRLSKDNLKPKEIDGINISGKKIKVNLEINDSEIAFRRFNYDHNSKSKFKFYILVLPFSEEIFESIKTTFSIKNPRIGSNKFTVVVSKNDESVFFGKGQKNVHVNVIESHQNLSYSLEDLEEKRIYISENSSGWEDDSLDFNLNIDDVTIPISIEEKDQRDFPVKSLEIWKLKRENKDNFIFNDVKVIQGSRVLYIVDVFKDYLKLEESIINNNIFYGVKKFGNEIEKYELNLNDDLKSAYQEILNYYKKINNVPSLVYLNDDLKTLYENFIDIFNEEIESIQEKNSLDSQLEKFDLFKIGMIKDNTRFLFSSLSPINIAYQLEIMNQCENEILERNILERLIPNNLVPYIFDDNDESQLYTPIYQTDAHEWLIYEKNKQVSLGTSNAFIANIVTEKIEQFITHFDYLFNLNIHSPIKLNIINIRDDTEFVKGIINFFYKILIGKSDVTFVPIEVNIYSTQDKCSLDEFFECDSKEDLLRLYDINIDEKKFDSHEIIRSIQENIKYYKHSVDVEQYGYAHISFYKSSNEEQSASHNMDVINTGLSLDGLVSSVNSSVDTKYKKGFGSKNILNKDNPLVRTSINLNELACNLEKNGINAYNKGHSIASLPPQIESNTAKNLYDVSHWVTFIEPNFDLEFFNQDSSNLIVIHYSDQYTSSSRYDTITVTNKSSQYENIIKEFLKTKDISIEEESLRNLIKMFNSINGEWLLRTISNDISDEREKLSIISAVKYGLAILDHPEITWIPISMEEILRIAGNVKLDRNKGVFTIKTLKEKGVHSDDLLFIGVRVLDDGKIRLYYYPIEVKIGKNFSPVINKGKKQVQNTYKLFREQLNQYDLDNKFRNKFFRNFFIQVLLSNEQKLSINHIWDEKFMDKFEEIKKNLLNDDYEISYNLESAIGIGSVISFATDNTALSIEWDENVQIINLTEYAAFTGLEKSIDNLCHKIQKGETDIPRELLLSNFDLNEIDGGQIPPVVPPEPPEPPEPPVVPPEPPEPPEPPVVPPEPPEPPKEIEGIRACIGTLKGSNSKVYWEFGHPKLANRHMLIQGKSGQGKTYYIQRMIKELSNQGISSIIIDYTDGFKPSQLESNFKDSCGDKIHQYFVVKEKFPLNPFKRNTIVIDEDISFDEDNSTIASRFKSIINSVYGLGIQQSNTLYQTVLNCLEKYDDSLDLNILKQELLKDESSVAQAVLNKLTELLDKNPFESTDFDWSVLDDNGGRVYIIQLTALSKDIQTIITEFILWDLWNYKSTKGSEENPFVVVLDEAHNLDFSKDSPCSKILTEGRKFGWSGWFATQSVKGSMKPDEIAKLENADEKIYFHPTDVGEIAKELAKDYGDKGVWERELSSLTKGQCIVKGSILDGDGELKNSKPLSVKIDEITFDEPKDTGGDGGDGGDDGSPGPIGTSSGSGYHGSPVPVGGSGGDSTPQPTDEEDIKIYNDFLRNQAGKYISNEDGEFIIFRIIKGDKKCFGKFNSMEIARDYEQKLIKNAWDFTLSDNVGTYGKFIRKEGNKFSIVRKIQGKTERFGPYDLLIDALLKREDLIDDNWGVNGEVNFVVEGMYGKYITFFNDVYYINRMINGDLFNFGKFDTLEDANVAKEILISNGWDGSQIPEQLFSWRFFASYAPWMWSWEVSNLIGEDIISFGFFPSKKSTKEAINILIKNNWDTSFIPLDLYSKLSNIRIFRKGVSYQVFRRINGDRISFGTFDTLEEAIKVRNELFLSNWSIDEDEDYPNENIYLRSGKYHVKMEIDGVMMTFGIFDTFEDAVEYRNLCAREGWNPSLIQKINNEMFSNEIEDLAHYLDRELKYFNEIKEYDFEYKDDILLQSDGIDFEDILNVFKNISILHNPDFPVPQLNNFNMLINLCENLYLEDKLFKNEICEMFELANRPYSYLISAGLYLGLIDKLESNEVKLSDKGYNIFSLEHDRKILGIVRTILETKLFYKIFALYLEDKQIPSNDKISNVLEDYGISGTTIGRRASTVRHWINWIISLYE